MLWGGGGYQQHGQIGFCGDGWQVRGTNVANYVNESVLIVQVV